MDDSLLLEMLLAPLRVSKAYRPRFGQGKGTGISLSEFQALYSGDSFYKWFGLDHPLMYAAHKAAGGITSVYRQIGIGCEQLFRHIIRTQFQLTYEQVSWSYVTDKDSAHPHNLSLDARIDLGHLSPLQATRFQQWLQDSLSLVGVSQTISAVVRGAVFEVRQGYKSKDSKRQNADIANAAVAYTEGYLPVLLLLSQQIDLDVALRYRGARWLLLNGVPNGDVTTSTYRFMREIIGYDLAAFFERQSDTLRQEVIMVLESLLHAD